MKNLTIDIQGQIALVQINRPKALNALNSETLDELYACLKEMELRRDIRILILTGAGTKAFVAGADISEMHQATAVEGLAMARLADRTFSLLENMPQVSIAAVNGYALGGDVYKRQSQGSAGCPGGRGENTGGTETVRECG